MFKIFHREDKAIRTARAVTAHRLYSAIVAQARQPALYSDYQVPDTVDGRYDLILLHAVVVIDLFQVAAESGQKLGQGIFDAMFRDLESGIREIGVSDMSIARHFRRMSEGFNGRRIAYSAALAAHDPAQMADAIARNIYRKTTDNVSQNSARLAQYIFAQYQTLAGQGLNKLLAGEALFAPAETAAVC